MNLAMILVLMSSCLIARISLTVKQAIRWLKAIHAPTFGAFREDLWWISISISVAGMRTKRSRSIIVNCVARIVLFKSHTVIRRFIFNNLRNCAVPLSTSAVSISFLFCLRAPLMKSTRSNRLLDCFPVIVVPELPLSELLDTWFFRLQKSFLFACFSFPHRKSRRDARWCLSSLLCEKLFNKFVFFIWIIQYIILKNYIFVNYLIKYIKIKVNNI